MARAPLSAAATSVTGSMPAQGGRLLLSKEVTITLQIGAKPQ